MADTDTDEGTPAAHGPAIAGKGKKGKGGLFSGPHREEIIVICSVIGVGLAYMTLRKAGSSAAGASTPSAALSTAGPSASLGTGSGQLAGGYSDGTQGLQAWLAQISDQLGGMEANLPADAGQGVTPQTPSPLASTLSAPTFSGQYVGYTGTGAVEEVESDGSLFHLSPGQWNTVGAHFGAAPGVVSIQGNAPSDYTSDGNLRAYVTAHNPAPAAK